MAGLENPGRSGRAEAPEAALARHGIRHMAGNGAPVDSAIAAKTLAFDGANNDLTFTAVAPGPAGNDLRVAIGQSEGVDVPIDVVVTTAGGWLATIMLPTKAPAASSLTIEAVGDNNDLTFAAVEAGLAGDELQVEIVQGEGVSVPLAVNVVGNLASIVLPTDGGVAASLTVDSLAANSDLTFTAADAGAAGNALQVEIVQGAGVDVPTSVAFAGGIATVTLPTDGGVQASLVVVSPEGNNDLTFTAVAAGPDGNNLTVAIAQASGLDIPLSVDYVAPNAIITLPSDGEGNPIAVTAAQVKAAWDASAALADMTVAFEGDGSGAVAAAEAAPLALGANGAPVAVTATEVKAVWDLSEAAAAITVAVEGDGTGAVDAVAAAPLANGAEGAPVATSAADIKAAWDATGAVVLMSVDVEGDGTGTVAAAAATNLSGGDDGGGPLATTAAQVKTAWDASYAVDKATLAVEGNGSGAVAVTAATNLEDGAGTGTGWAGKGSDYTDTATGRQYGNVGTMAAPIWKLARDITDMASKAYVDAAVGG